MFNTAIDSKLRGCDLVKLRVADIYLGDSVRLRTTVMQQKTGRPVPLACCGKHTNVLDAMPAKIVLIRVEEAEHERQGRL